MDTEGRVRQGGLVGRVGKTICPTYLPYPSYPPYPPYPPYLPYLP